MNRLQGLRLSALAGLCLTGLALPALADSVIPARPEELKYPPLEYHPPDAATYRATLSNGMAAYLVPDRTLPLVNVVVLLRIGPDLDREGKEGLAATTMHLLTRSGAGPLSAEQLEERVAFLGAQLESGMGSGAGMFGMGGAPISASESRVTLNLLSKDLDEGLKLLTDCLAGASFQEDRLRLRVDQEAQDLKTRNDESAAIEDYEWGYLMRGEDHWSNRYATEASLRSLTREDLVAFQKRYIGPRNFVLAVSGDFDRAQMLKKLEKAFGSWPVPGENPGPPPAPKEPSLAGWFIANKDVNQTRVSIGLTAVDRYDPDYYAATIMNQIMGGGSFTSRLVNRIRSDEGLAYQVASRLESGLYYPDPWRIVFQTKSRSTAWATQIALEEVRKIREEPVSDEEMATAKNYLVESFPSRYATAAAIAGALAADELTGRYQKDPKYYAEYTPRVKAVTKEDVQRVAQELLDPARMTFLFVGNAAEIARPDGKHEVTLARLAGEEPARIPLRDPATMKPIP